MKKIISLLGCCFIAISTLTACENNNLPAWADTDVLTPKAQTMIDTLNAFDYDGVAEIYNNPAVYSHRCILSKPFLHSFFFNG